MKLRRWVDGIPGQSDSQGVLRDANRAAFDKLKGKPEGAAHHYKHWSMDMTALYARNTQQELFDEVLQAVREKKIRVIEHWLDDDCMVIGGAATGVKAFKAKYRLETVATRKGERDT
jgi:hypothetical protein